jgi:uncharacterized membrane protein YbhN (UPF0104 family)
LEQRTIEWYNRCAVKLRAGGNRQVHQRPETHEIFIQDGGSISSGDSAATEAGSAERAEAGSAERAGAGSAERAGAGSAERDAHRLRNGLIWTCALGLLLLGIGLAVPDLRDVLDRVAHAHLGWLLLGIILELGSCLGYVATVRLVLHRGPAREIRWLAWAEMAFGALVPVGGAGGLAVGAWAMRAWGIAWERIANRSAVIFLLTSGINVAVLALAGLGVWAGVGSARLGFVYGLLPAIIGAGAIAVFALVPRVRWRRLAPVVRRLGSWVSDTEVIASRPDWRLLGAISYLLLDIGVLWACLRAVGTNPPLLALVLGYQIGYLANVVPIPGGLGVLEGGLLGALLLYGLPAAPTAAAVVLYHAIALWVPSIGGTVGFVRLRRSVAARSGRVAGVSEGSVSRVPVVPGVPVPGVPVATPAARLEAVRGELTPADAPAASDLAA